MNTKQIDETMLVSDAASILGVRPQFVYSLLERGKMESVMINRLMRVYRSDVYKRLAEFPNDKAARANRRRLSRVAGRPKVNNEETASN